MTRTVAPVNGVARTTGTDVTVPAGPWAARTGSRTVSDDPPAETVSTVGTECWESVTTWRSIRSNVTGTSSWYWAQAPAWNSAPSAVCHAVDGSPSTAAVGPAWTSPARRVLDEATTTDPPDPVRPTTPSSTASVARTDRRAWPARANDRDVGSQNRRDSRVSGSVRGGKPEPRWRSISSVSGSDRDDGPAARRRSLGIWTVSSASTPGIRTSDRPTKFW